MTGDYLLGHFRDGEFIDIDCLRGKSESKKLVFIKEDATTFVYDKSCPENIADEWGEAKALKGKYVIFEQNCISLNEEDDCYRIITGDEVNEYTKTIVAYDKEGDDLYAESFISLDDADDVYISSEYIGMDAALKALVDEIEGDEDVVMIKVVKD
jgi:hypothetical protein